MKVDINQKSMRYCHGLYYTDNMLYQSAKKEDWTAIDKRTGQDNGTKLNNSCETICYTQLGIFSIQNPICNWTWLDSLFHSRL